MAADSGFPFSLTDAVQNTEEFSRPPKRVIALYGALNELLLALGAQDAIVARTSADGEIPSLAHLPSIGTHMRPNPELILAQKPDLVLQLKGRGEALANLDLLQKQGIKTLVFEIESFQDLMDLTQKLGRIMRREEEAERLLADWQGRLQALAIRNKGKNSPRVFYEARYPNLLAAGTGGIVNAIISAAGGSNIIESPKKLVRVSEELLFLKEPDIYIIQRGPMNPSPEPLDKRGALGQLLAGKKVIYVDERKFARPGPHSVEAAEELHKWLFKEEE